MSYTRLLATIATFGTILLSAGVVLGNEPLRKHYADAQMTAGNDNGMMMKPIDR
jgi:hypothetical protein